jgi:H+/Cl- antiporter ClcA
MAFFRAKQKTDTRSFPMLCWVTLLVGIVSGVAGTLLALLLHFTQHIAYGYSLGTMVSDESFLEGVRASSPERRVFILTLCGLIAGLGWWALYRYGKPLVSIAAAVRSDKPNMPMGTTIIHVLLQIITVGLGSPLGREVAPRELSAIFSGWLAAKAGLTLKDTQIMIACGAGAGLAAVYNVPFGGALFTLEVLLQTVSWPALIPAFATSAIAVVISWVGLGNQPQYYIPPYDSSYSLILWSIITGPLFGLAGYGFIRIITLARKTRQYNWQLPVFCLINFTLIGCLAIYFPALLGNGRSPAQLAFDNETTVALAFVLLVLRTLITWSSFRAGAEGGVLTPSLADGALLAIVLGGFWNMVWPNPQLGAYAIIGAAAFLAAAQKMPITAIVLIFEFTRIHFNFLIPILFAVTGAVGVSRLCAGWKKP